MGKKELESSNEKARKTLPSRASDASREETRKLQLNELKPTYDDYMRSKACDQVTHSRGLTPHRLILWRQIF